MEQEAAKLWIQMMNKDSQLETRTAPPYTPTGYGPIDVDEVMAMIDRRRALNQNKLSNAVFVRDGKPIEIPQEVRDEFEFTGLGLFDFVELVIFGETIEYEPDGTERKYSPPILERRNP